MADLDGRADALELLAVSRETVERLKAYEQLLLRWQKIKNLISPSTEGSIWTRHFVDSLQLRRLAPDATQWADIGSGAGLPGLVVAIDLVGSPNANVHLIEADNRKCAFLREAIRATGALASVHHGRAEEIAPRLPRVDIVTARAVAPMNKLVEIAEPMLCKGATALFLKGQDYAAELTGLDHGDRFNIRVVPSLTDERARIVVLTMKPFCDERIASD